jgi:hypothetical protein
MLQGRIIKKVMGGGDIRAKKTKRKTNSWKEKYTNTVQRNIPHKWATKKKSWKLKISYPLPSLF